MKSGQQGLELYFLGLLGWEIADGNSGGVDRWASAAEDAGRDHGLRTQLCGGSHTPCLELFSPTCYADRTPRYLQGRRF